MSQSLTCDTVGVGVEGPRAVQGEVSLPLYLLRVVGAGRLVVATTVQPAPLGGVGHASGERGRPPRNASGGGARRLHTGRKWAWLHGRYRVAAGDFPCRRRRRAAAARDSGLARGTSRRDMLEHAAMGLFTCPSAELCRYRRCSLPCGVRCGLALPRFPVRELPDVTSPETGGLMTDGCSPLGCSALAAATATATPRQPSRGARGAPSLCQFRLAATRACGASTTCLASWCCVRAARTRSPSCFVCIPGSRFDVDIAVTPAQGTTCAPAGSAGDNTHMVRRDCKRPRAEEVGADVHVSFEVSGGLTEATQAFAPGE